MSVERITIKGRSLAVDRRCAGQVVPGGRQVRVAWLLSSKGANPIYVTQDTCTSRLSATGDLWLRSMTALELHDAVAPLLPDGKQPQVIHAPEDAGWAVVGRTSGARLAEPGELWAMFLDDTGQVAMPAVRVALDTNDPATVAHIVADAKHHLCAQVVLAFRLPDDSDLPRCPVSAGLVAWNGAARVELERIGAPVLRHVLFVAGGRFVTVESGRSLGASR